jgi:hypothetical protein
MNISSSTKSQLEVSFLSCADVILRLCREQDGLDDHKPQSHVLVHRTGSSTVHVTVDVRSHINHPESIQCQPVPTSPSSKQNKTFLPNLSLAPKQPEATKLAPKGFSRQNQPEATKLSAKRQLHHRGGELHKGPVWICFSKRKNQEKLHQMIRILHASPGRRFILRLSFVLRLKNQKTRQKS